MRYFCSQLTILLSLVCFDSAVQAQLDPARLPQADSTAQELNVLNPGLAPEEIDRAVLTRLLNEINIDAEQVAILLDASGEELEEISITLANARSFVNSNEMASVRAMCNAWNNSRLTGDDRIREALDAYKTGKQFTLNFVQRYYSVVIRDIQAILDNQSSALFDRYLQDRRLRMANSGSAYASAIVENVRSGAESVEFHCGLPRE